MWWFRVLPAFIISLTLYAEATCAQAEPCGRIVTLSPSATEILFDAGLGEQVVGTSSYVDYPPGARKLPKLGGLLDPNTERILLLKPTVVVLLPSQREVGHILSRAGIRILEIDVRSIEELLAAYSKIGSACKREAEATAARERLASAIDEVSMSLRDASQLRALVVVGSLVRPGDLSPLYVSGNDGIYSTLLERLGAKNAVPSKTGPLGVLSKEGLSVLKPDIIMQITPPSSDAARQKELWNGANLSLASGRKIPVLVANQSYASIPGPRIVKLMQLLRDFLMQQNSGR